MAKPRMSRRRISLYLASSIAGITLLARGASAILLQSANFSIPTQNYNTAGSTGAQSANFRTFVDMGDVIGVSNESAMTAWVGHTYTLFSTLALLPPSSLSAVSLSGNKIVLFWNSSPSPDILAYHIYWDSGTGTVNYSTPMASLSAAATSYITGILVSSAAYKFALRGLNFYGIEEANTNVVASAAAQSSLAGVSAAIKVPDSGKRIAGNRVTVVAELVTGSISQTGQVLFQYKASTASVWSNIPPADANHPNPDAVSPYFVHWDVTGLTSTNYDLRAVATDVSGNADPTPPSITITVDPANSDINETDLGGGKIQKQQVVNNGASSTIETGDGGTSVVTKVSIPAGALNSSTLTVTVVNNPVAAPTSSGGTIATGVATQINLSNGQTALIGGQTAAITITYPDADNDGIVDGTTARADRLKIYSYDAVAGTWKQDIASSVDTTNHIVTGNTPHFSFFGVFAGVAADLSTVRVYPIPYKPTGGNSDEGVPFSSSNPNSGIIFDNLPNSVMVKIYTVTGQLVTKFGSDSTSGKLQWNVKNDSGRDVASGLYVAVVSSPGQKVITKKILVVR